jgi:hypothetical protein
MSLITPTFGTSDAVAVSKATLYVGGTQIAPGAAYEVVNVNGVQVLRLKNRRTFVSGGTVAANDTAERGWSKTNFATANSVATADDNTTNAGQFTLSHGTAITDWTTVAQTAPFRWRPYLLIPGRTIEVLARIANNADADFEFGFVQAIRASAPGTFARIGVGFTTANIVIRSAIGATLGTTVNITATQRDAGPWFRLVISGTGVAMYYSLTDQETPPNDWTFLQGGTFAALGDVLRIGLNGITVNASGTLVNRFKYLSIDTEPTAQDATAGLLWGAVQFDATNPEQVLIADYDLEDSAAVIDQARLRQVLADAVNVLPTDLAAWTFACKQSQTPGATSGTYAAANSVVVEGSGRYANLWARCSSTGELAGSLRLPLILRAN